MRCRDIFTPSEDDAPILCVCVPTVTLLATETQTGHQPICVGSPITDACYFGPVDSVGSKVVVPFVTGISMSSNQRIYTRTNLT